jgi:hypothetical protein
VDLVTARAALKARGFQYLDDATVTVMLNNAKNALEDWFIEAPWLETTQATGAPPLTISDLHSVIYVLNATNDVPLQGVDARDVSELDGDLSTTGTAQYWWLDGLTTVRTYPIDSAAQVSVRYRKYSSELANASDTPSIPARYHPVWIDLAVVEALKDDDNYQAAQLLLQDVNRRLDEMQTTFLLRNRQGADAQVITGIGSEDW